MKTTIMINGQPLTNVEVLAAPTLDMAQPVTTWAPIPGGMDINTSVLMTGGVPTFHRPHVVLPCVLTSGETLWGAQRRLIPALSGHTVDLGFDERPGWHLTGCVKLTNWDWPGKADIVTFTLTLDGDPYWWKNEPTTLVVKPSASPGTAFDLPQTGYTVMPEVTVSGGGVTLVQGTTQTSLPVGVTSWVDGLIIVPQLPGQNPTPVSGRIIGATTSTVTFRWREGWPG